MLFATMCVGNEFVSLHKDSINAFSKDNQLHILTDSPSEFSNSISHQYTRDVFSYYEKINFVIRLSKKYKQRITYIDCDCLSKIKTNLIFDDTSLYVETMFSLDEKNVITETFPNEIILREKLLPLINGTGNFNYYIYEPLFSLPFLSNLDDIEYDSIILQNYLENIFNYNTKNIKLKKYKKQGIGFAEGWGMAALSIKYNIPIKEICWFNKSWI